jgi:hypothetical protein
MNIKVVSDSDTSALVSPLEKTLHAHVNFFFKRTTKVLPRFLLDEERKKASVSPVF